MLNRHSSILLLLLSVSLILSAKEAERLFYTSPSATWLGALPLGNGRIGAMVYGGTGRETIALSELTLWSGQPDPDANNICGPERLREIRQAFLGGDYQKGNELGWQALSGKGKSFGTHLPFGSLVIESPAPTDTPQDYSRELLLGQALARVRYNNVSREYFCSNPAQVLVVKCQSLDGTPLSASIGMELLRHGSIRATGLSSHSAELDIAGDARFSKNGEGGVRYRSIVRVTAQGGSVSAQGERLQVAGAKQFVILFDLRTDFQNLAYRTQVYRNIEEASRRNYADLRKEHIRDHQQLYRRMAIKLGPDDDIASLTTEQLFQQARQGKASPAFDALFFRYGRYMQIASSRSDSPLPSNLQGVWNDNLACNMPWTCDYHLDINIQQNYWSANIANLASTNTPLFSYLSLLAAHGSHTARKMYGCGGWVAHTINNVWGNTAPGSSPAWAMNVTAGAWLATHLWTHYEYTLDVDFLRQLGYPLLKETAQFFLDYMVEDPQTGWLLSGPSISPEVGFRGSDGRGYALSMMPTIDRAVIFHIYRACIDASRILGVDSDLRSRLEQDIAKLPPLRLRPNGELAEWLLDVDRTDPAHRHSSHLLALYPLSQITPEDTPLLARGCERFLSNQCAQQGWEDTEWTRGNNICYYARLHDGHMARQNLLGLYSGFMRQNLMTVSPAGVAGAQCDIFSFDATEAAVAGMCEMLLQSRLTPDGVSLNFLPALPTEWPSGSIRGICARGAIEADIAWKEGKLTKAIIRPNRNMKATICINGQLRELQLKAGKATKL